MKSGTKSKVGNKKGSPAYRTPSWNRVDQSKSGKNYGPTKDWATYNKFRKHRAR
ncbi:hypothetical protein IT409_02015 [Candidatus Falkowbacteria bacterium]|nr:hypothetical protein [Candidatus Falkowbacteria bacterium]